VTLPIWVVVTHFLNLLLMSLLARSGIEVLSAHPKLYRSDDSPPGRPLLRFSKKVFTPDSRHLWTSQDEEEEWSPVLALPGRGHLGLGRHWHFASVQFWVLTGVVYVALLFASGDWRHIVPQTAAIVPHAINATGSYLQFHFPPENAYGYNAAQQLSYFIVIFVLAPLQIATGAAMSPAVIGRFPRFARLFGGKQGARTLHFLGLCAFAVFLVIHTTMVVIHGVPKEMAVIALGSEHHSHAVAVVVAGVALLFVIAVNWAATAGSLRRPRRVQLLLGRLVDPMERALSRSFRSKQRFGAGDISPYHRINGRPPPDNEYRELVENGFEHYRLEVSGMVERPLSLSLTDLRGLEWSDQITKHNCIQGWTDIAGWAGVPLAAILDVAGVQPGARYLVFHAFDDKGKTEPQHGAGYFYGSTSIELARSPQAILALEMNGKPLAVEYGAPARVRLENQLGFKMVKWVRAIEVVRDYAAFGDGQGGWREDHQYYTTTAGI
jgi:DMSO/TMAO reductase YedYZ molybdopterin-dependent catalytic subunit/thiosulfate reductase cytochrome b subunit